MVTLALSILIKTILCRHRRKNLILKPTLLPFSTLNVATQNQIKDDPLLTKSTGISDELYLPVPPERGGFLYGKMVGLLVISFRV